MKKRILSLILSIVILVNCGAIFAADETAFSDVANSHWAIEYIYAMKQANVINGYEDGTFKPEKQVKTGEFIKMLCMAVWPDYEYKNVSSAHWSVQYLMTMDRIILNKNEYSPERLERVITREEAAELICRFVQFWNSESEVYGTLETEGNYISAMKDEALIKDEQSRIYIDNCIRFGLINGFDDGTFKPTNGLTRAQAAKLIYSAKYVQ